MSFEIKKISLIDLEKIFSLFSNDIKLNDLSIKTYLCNFIDKSINNKITRDKIINYLRICYYLTKEEYLDIAKKEIQTEDDLKVFINSNNIETGVLNKCNINYADFEELLYNGILNSCFGWFSSLEENKENDKTKTIKINKIKLNSEQIYPFIENKLTEEEIKNNLTENYELKIAKTNYNEAMELKKEIQLRSENFSFLNKDFIEKLCKSIKIDNKELTYEKFLEIVDSDFMLAIELLYNIVNYNFTFECKKKIQFFLK